MSGQRDQWDGLEELDELDQPDPREATLDLSRLIERVRYQIQPDAQRLPAGDNGGNGSSSGSAGGMTAREPGAGAGRHAAGNGSSGQPPTDAGAHLSGLANAPSAEFGEPATGMAAAVAGEPKAVAGWPQSAVAEPNATVADPQALAETKTTVAEFRAVAEPKTTVAEPRAVAEPKTTVAEPEAVALTRTTAPADGEGTEIPVSPAIAEVRASADAAPRSSRDHEHVRCEPGSLADLRHRLERLPFGHPSSPYHVNGERKPPPPRLMHLELAPPGPERPAADPARLSWAASVTALDGDSGEAVPAVGPESHSDGVAAASQESGPVTGSVAAAGGAGPASDNRGPTVGAPAGPPRAEADGSWTWGRARLTRDQVRVAEDAHDRFREAEGRDLFGSFHSSGLTARLRDLVDQLENGRLAPGAEDRALLGPDEFKARLASMIRRHPERTAEQLAGRVPGALSYSFVFESAHYSAGIWIVQDLLEARGFRLQARKNGWSGPENKCVLAMWRDPLTRLPFEIQFHTVASLEAQQLARSSATLINDPRIPRSEAANLKSDLALAWAALPTPPGNTEISDYRLDGRTTTPAPSPQPAQQPGRSIP